MGKNNKKNKRVAAKAVKAAEEQAALQEIVTLKQQIADREVCNTAPTKYHYQAAHALIKSWGEHPLGVDVDWLVPFSKTSEDIKFAAMMEGRIATLAQGGVSWWCNSASVPANINQMLTQEGWGGQPAIHITSPQGDMTTSRCWFNAWALAEVMGGEFVAGFEVKYDSKGWLRIGSHGVVLGHNGVLYDPTHTGGDLDKQKWFIPCAEATAWFNHVVDTHPHLPPHNAIIIATKFFEGYTAGGNGACNRQPNDVRISSRDVENGNAYFSQQAIQAFASRDPTSLAELWLYLSTILPFFYTANTTTAGEVITGMTCDPTTGTRTWNIPQRWRGENSYFNCLE